MKKIIGVLFAVCLSSVPASAQITNAGNVLGPASATNGHCVQFNGTSGKKLSDSGSACGAGGGSLTVTDGTNSVASTTQITVGNGLVIGGTTPNATLTPTTPDSTKNADYTVAASNMGGVINLTGTHTLTIPAISSTVLASGMSVCYSNIGSGTWTISTTPTINGMTGTSIPPGGAGCWVSNGTSLDYQPGVQPPSSTVIGGLVSPVPVANGGTALTSGTSGGVLCYTASGTLASSSALTANLPVIGGGAGVCPSVGTVTGNTTKFATSTGTLTSGNCIKSDASGNLIDAATTCGGGGGGGIPTLGYRANQFYGPFLAGPHLAVTLVANRAYYAPFLSLETKTFTKISIFVTSSSTSNCELGVYSAGAGVPGTLIDDSGAVAVTGTGQKTITGRSIALTANTWYYVVVLCAATPALDGVNGSNSAGQVLIDAMLGASAPGFGADQNYGAQAFGALPGTFPATTQNAGGTQPLVWLGF